MQIMEKKTIEYEIDLTEDEKEKVSTTVRLLRELSRDEVTVKYIDYEGEHIYESADLFELAINLEEIFFESENVS